MASSLLFEDEAWPPAFCLRVRLASSLSFEGEALPPAFYLKVRHGLQPFI